MVNTADIDQKCGKSPMYIENEAENPISLMAHQCPAWRSVLCKSQGMRACNFSGQPLLYTIRPR